MSYATHDFEESLRAVRIDPLKVSAVIAAWGLGDGMGSEDGNGSKAGWTEDGVTDWRGGFLFRSTDGRFGYLTGWCDYTGWGCQDGARVSWSDDVPNIWMLRDYFGDEVPLNQWDIVPADLNRWLDQNR
jgi:hypothetical protein